VELVSSEGGAHLLIHQAGKAQKAGQSQTKLVFDVESFSAICEKTVSPSALFIKAMAMSSPMRAIRPEIRSQCRAVRSRKAR
jgi:hypothetical protein